MDPIIYISLTASPAKESSFLMSFNDWVGEGLAPTGILNQNHMWNKKITVHIHFLMKPRYCWTAKSP
jgi:hypothetical protein